MATNVEVEISGSKKDNIIVEISRVVEEVTDRVAADSGNRTHFLCIGSVPGHGVDILNITCLGDGEVKIKPTSGNVLVDNGRKTKKIKKGESYSLGNHSKTKSVTVRESKRSNPGWRAPHKKLEDV